MTAKHALMLATSSILLMLGVALFSGNMIVVVACLGGFCSGMAVMSAVFHWPDK